MASAGLSGRGGIGRTMSYLVRQLRVQAPDLDVSVLRTRFSETRILKHLSMPPALLVFVVALLLRRIEVVHINVAPRGSTWRKMAFAALARRLGRRVILHLHGSGYDAFYAAQSMRRRSIIRHFFGQADHVVALSRSWAAFLCDEIGVPRERVVEIPNGVPGANVTDRTGAAGPPGIAFLGEVGHRKGIDVLLDALAILAGRGVEFRATVGGDGALAQARARASELGLGDRVVFVGWVGEVEVDRILRDCDVFTLPSRAENQPVAILEAMACGRPVVATHVGAIPEQVVDGETGFVVPPGDAPALAAALERLITQPDLRASFGERGLARFRERFSVEAYADRFAALYRARPHDA